MPAEVGRQYLGRVTEVLPEWVAVELASGQHALLHLTRILPRGVRLRSAVGVLAVGDHVRVTVAEVNERRGGPLAMKAGTLLRVTPVQPAMRRDRLWLVPLLLSLLFSAGCFGSGSSRTPATDVSRPVSQTTLMTVPKVVGLPVLAAADRLRRAGFAVTVPRFYLSSQTPQPVVTRESPAGESMLMQGNVVTLKLEYRCCIGSPGWSTTRALLMPSVVGQSLNVALRRVRRATGFYAVSVPPATATLHPLLATYKVTAQWPRPGFDLRHQTGGFRLPELTVAQI